jgi:hypothetical protein
MSTFFVHRVNATTNRNRTNIFQSICIVIRSHMINTSKVLLQSIQKQVCLAGFFKIVVIGGMFCIGGHFVTYLIITILCHQIIMLF